MHFLCVVAVFQALLVGVSLVVAPGQEHGVFFHLFIVVNYFCFGVALIERSEEVNDDWLSTASISFDAGLD